MKPAILFTLILFANLVFPAASNAASQCPSNAYFRTSAENYIESSDFELTLCVSIVTRSNVIRLKGTASIELLRTQEIEQSLFDSVTSSHSCNLLNANGWQLSEMALSFPQAKGRSAKIRIVGVAKPCAFSLLRGKRLVYEASLTPQFADGMVSFTVARGTATLAGFPIPSFEITAGLNGFLQTLTFDPREYFPNLDNFDIAINGADLRFLNHRLSLRLTVSAAMTDATADIFLREYTKGWTINHIKGAFARTAPSI